jgi:hypothetical protein
LNNRKNDNAPVSMIEFVDFTPSVSENPEVEETTEDADAE